MQNKYTTKGIIAGIIIGLLIAGTGTFAATTGAGTIGSLFKDIGAGHYRLMGTFIEDGTVGKDELGANSVGNSEIVNTSDFTMNNLTLDGGNINLKGQKLVGNGFSFLTFNSNTTAASALKLQNTDDLFYGSVYGASAGGAFGLRDGDNNWSYLSSKGNYISFSVGGNEKMRIKNDGNVGIRETNPTHKLDVNGKIRMGTQTAITDEDDIVATKKYVDDVAGTSSLGIQRAYGTKVYSGKSDGATATSTCPAGYQLITCDGNFGSHFKGRLSDSQIDSGIINETGDNNEWVPTHIWISDYNNNKCIAKSYYKGKMATRTSVQAICIK